ncbi:MAG: mechanosensitive ion channel family protein [Candidatus Magasanikbacteria bacterium]|nr:mechanosensitive ion channel family protein [Candidatus Magasanikbacteria bacterium]
MFENQLINSVLIILGFWLASYVVTILMSVLEKIASKTGTTLDDNMIKAAKLPVRYLFILLGFYYAVKYYDMELKWKDYDASDFFYALIVLLVCFTISRMLKTFFVWYESQDRISKRRGSKTMFIFVQKVISFAVYAVALILILGHFGVEVGPLLAGLGVAGLAIALGLQETLANLFAALFLVMDKSINIGDYIQLEDGTKAFIEDVSWRSVRIRTISGNTVIVPNSVFVGQKISSYDYPESPYSMEVPVGVAYGSDLDFVESVVIKAALKVVEEMKVKAKKNPPLVRYKKFADSSIEFIVIVTIDKVTDESPVKHALIKEIYREFKKENIEIPFPQRVIHQK